MTGGTQLDDRRLVELYLLGEREAHALVDGWLALACAPFRRRLAAEWQDVQQELRLEVLELLRRDRFRGESSLKTYLWRVACHTCLDALRRQRRRPQLEPLDESRLDPPANGPSPLDAALRGESHRVLLEQLERQSRECRELWAAILAGQSYAEIALRTGLSAGALRVRAHRCRKRALADLHRNAGGDGDAQSNEGGGSGGLS